MKADMVPYEDSHYFQLGGSPLSKRIGGLLTDNCHAVTFLIDGRPALILGVNIPHTGLVEVFFLPGELFYSNITPLVRETKRWYAYIESQFHWRRIQAMVRDDIESHCRFAQWLGLEQEAVLHRYGPDGETMRIYSKVR